VGFLGCFQAAGHQVGETLAVGDQAIVSIVEPVSCFFSVIEDRAVIQIDRGGN
jgi:hypothetical protein